MKHPISHLHSSIRVLFLSLLVTFAGVILAAPPSCLADQAPAPAQTEKTSSASSGTDGLLAQPGQEKKEEQEEDNVYRHTPLVQKLANAFHLDVETTARLFEYINFAIIILAIVIPLFRVLPRMMRKRQETLSHQLDDARKTTADANTRLSAVEAQMARLDEEIAKIRAQVEQESKQDEERIKASIGEESARIVAAAEQEISVAAAQARRGLRTFAADLAIEQAAHQLVLTPETDRELIAQFVRDAANGTSKGSNRGGMN